MMNHRQHQRRPSPQRLIFQPGKQPPRDVLVTLFLRGGIDGLTALPRLGDKNIATARGSLAVPDPGRGSRTIDLDGKFGLHEALAPWQEIFRDGKLAVVPAAGTSFDTTSHFDAMKTVEYGGTDPTGLTSGWLARFLNYESVAQPSPLRVVAVDRLIPEALSGTQALALPELSEFRLDVPAEWSPKFLPLLEQAYRNSEPLVARASRDIFRLLAQVKQVNAQQPNSNVQYPQDTLGHNLAQVAKLIKADLGLEVATIDIQGWDTHINQGPKLHQLLTSLAEGVRAFHDDLGAHLNRVTLVIYSEFGRRIQVNASHGTDHGRATTFWVMGGGIRGGIYGDWPHIEREQINSISGNLRVTTDVRHILAELLQQRMGSKHLGQIFPGFEPKFLGLAKADA